MFEYRVTKYDDLGRSFGGELLTAEAYQRVEDAYVTTALGFWAEVGRPTLTARGVYCAYVGVSEPCPASCALAAASGLFMEAMASPHHPRTT